jgi:hypothetical protein
MKTHNYPKERFSFSHQAGEFRHQVTAQNRPQADVHWLIQPATKNNYEVYEVYEV